MLKECPPEVVGQHCVAVVEMPPAVQSAVVMHRRVVDVSTPRDGTQSDGDAAQARVDWRLILLRQQGLPPQSPGPVQTSWPVHARGLSQGLELHSTSEKATAIAKARAFLMNQMLNGGRQPSPDPRSAV